MKSYRKGRNFEYRVIKIFSQAGYYTVRSAGSHGIFDIIAVKDGKVYGIQCKTADILTEREKRRMIDAYYTYGIIPLYAYRLKRRVHIVNVIEDCEVQIHEQ